MSPAQDTATTSGPQPGVHPADSHDLIRVRGARENLSLIHI